MAKSFEKEVATLDSKLAKTKISGKAKPDLKAIYEKVKPILSMALMIFSFNKNIKKILYAFIAAMDAYTAAEVVEEP